MTSPVEWIAVLLGIANIILLVRRSIWNFPCGIAMVILYFFIFREAQLYSDMVLQLFFLVVQSWGWWAWIQAGGGHGPVEVERMEGGERIMWLFAVAVFTAIWGLAMARFTDAVAPWWDAAVAMGSIAAQILLVRRKIENWMGWIAVDLVAIALYASRDLWLTAGLYVLFLVISIIGLMEWQRAEDPMAD